MPYLAIAILLGQRSAKLIMRNKIYCSTYLHSLLSQFGEGLRYFHTIISTIPLERTKQNTSKKIKYYTIPLYICMDRVGNMVECTIRRSSTLLFYVVRVPSFLQRRQDNMTFP